ncbi:hypothetical protein AB9F34_33475, partial [Rhizobium leguminosarum]
ALLQTTKRWQLFLLDRRTGTPLAEVQEKPVPQQCGVPEEKLSPTQPYSVGMPTIGAERVTEQSRHGGAITVRQVDQDRLSRQIIVPDVV